MGRFEETSFECLAKPVPGLGMRRYRAEVRDERNQRLVDGRRIVFDVSMARGGGGFTYAVNVIPLLAERLPGTEFMVILRSPRIAESLPPLENLTVHSLPEEMGLKDRLRFLGWTAPALAKSWGADLYYSASELSPFSCPCPKVAAFRNANLFTELELGWPLIQRVRMKLLRLLAFYSARTCSRILFVSEHSAQWIGDYVRLPEARRITVPHGINEDLWTGPAGASPFNHEFVLSVSSVYRYKNFVRLIEAWTRVLDRWPEAPDLVIVGDDQDALHSGEMRKAREVAGINARRIHIVGEVPYSDIARYYKHAKAFVFPSYLETFGHPLLEAMAAGIPVAASDLGVFREVGGDAAVYFPPHDTGAMASSIELLLRDPERRRELVQRGYRRVRKYSWSETVDRMISMFRDVLEPTRM